MFPPLTSPDAFLVPSFVAFSVQRLTRSNHCKPTQVFLSIGFLILFLYPFLYAKPVLVGIWHNY